MALLDKEISNEDQRELGPLKYLATITNWSMDRVVNWFLLLIIFVFDPLAIALIVAANMAFAQIRKPKEEDYFSERNKHLDEVAMSVPEGKEFNTPYPMYSSSQEPNELLIKKVKESQDKLKEEITVDGGEIEVTVEPTKEQMEELEEHEGKKFAKGLDTVIQVMEEEEKEKEDIYKEKPNNPEVRGGQHYT